jgi:hypothetical protein
MRAVSVGLPQSTCLAHRFTFFSTQYRIVYDLFSLAERLCSSGYLSLRLDIGNIPIRACRALSYIQEETAVLCFTSARVFLFSQYFPPCSFLGLDAVCTSFGRVFYTLVRSDPVRTIPCMQRFIISYGYIEICSRMGALVHVK